MLASSQSRLSLSILRRRTIPLTPNSIQEFQIQLQSQPRQLHPHLHLTYTYVHAVAFQRAATPRRRQPSVTATAAT